MAYLVLAPPVEMMRRLLQASLLILAGACGVETPTPIDTESLEADASTPDANETPVPEALIPPPSRRPIEGVHGFTARSLIEFRALPDSPHRLSATYTFPDPILGVTPYLVSRCVH